MKLVQMELTRSQIRTPTRPHPPLVRGYARILTLVARLKVAWCSAHWRSWVRAARSKPKALSVRETAALGDRRFVCVIQFERQRFLIASSPSSVTLLAQLPDDSPGSEVTGEKH